jgi:hypothetical protein
MWKEGGNNFVPRVASFIEVNLDFYFFNDNVFHFGRKNMLPIFKLVGGGGGDNNLGDRSVNTTYNNVRGKEHSSVVEMLVTEMANRLFTVCAIYNEKPYI